MWKQASYTPTRFDWWVSVCVLVAVIFWQWEFYQTFNVDNQQFAKGVCCGFTDAMFDATLKLERNEPVDFSKGYASYIAAEWWRYWERHPAALLWLSQMSHILTGALILLIGYSRRLPLVGLVGATAFLCTPINVYASLRWDVYSLQAPLIVLGWGLVYWSRGFSSFLATAAFAGVSWVSAFWSFRETDNLILILLQASLAAGVWISALWNGRDAESRVVHRGVSSMLALTTCTVLLWGIASYFQFSSPEGIAYYFREADSPMMESRIELTSSLRWFGYWGHLYWRALGPVLAGMALVAFVVLGVSKRLPMGLFVAVLVPYVALSWISKRNFYYPSILWVILPLVIGEGVQVLSIAWGRRLLTLVVLSMVGWNLSSRLNGETLQGDEQYGGLFQTSDGNITLEPTRFWGVDDLASTIAETLKSDGCTEDVLVVLEANAMIEEVALRLGASHPCVQFKRQLQNREQRVLDTVQVWVIDPKHSQTETERLKSEGFSLTTEVLMDNRFRLNVWVR